MDRHRISSGTVWEDRFGYSRAVRVGQHVHVSGTTAVDADGSVIGVDDAGAQTAAILEIIESALEEAGASVDDVVRTTIYITDIDDFEAVGEAHAEVFGSVKPAMAMVEVSGLVLPELLVEVEATAIVDG